VEVFEVRYSPPFIRLHNYVYAYICNLGITVSLNHIAMNRPSLLCQFHFKHNKYLKVGIKKCPVTHNLNHAYPKLFSFVLF